MLSPDTLSLLKLEIAKPRGGQFSPDSMSGPLSDAIENDLGATPINWAAIIALMVQLLPLIISLFGGGATPTPAPTPPAPKPA